MFFQTLNRTKLKRIKGALQVVMTLVSFFGFNEAVLALRYRSSLHVNSFNCRITEAETPLTELFWRDYTLQAEEAEQENNPDRLFFLGS